MASKDEASEETSKNEETKSVKTTKIRKETLLVPHLPSTSEVLSQLSKRQLCSRSSAKNVRLDVDGDGTPTPVNESNTLKVGDTTFIIMTKS